MNARWVLFVLLTIFISSCRDASTSLPSDAGKHWEMTSGPGATISVMAAYDSVTYALGAALWISRDNGTTWTSKPLPAQLLGASTIIRYHDVLFIGGDGIGVYRSGDEGTSWYPSSTGLISPKKFVIALVSNSTSLFAGTNEGGVFRSTDNGDSWSAVNNGLTNSIVEGLLIKNDLVFAVVPPSISGGELHAGGIFYSPDLGAHWSLANNGLTDSTVYALVTHGDLLVAATSTGLFVSSDNGATWMMRNKDIDANSLESDGKNLIAFAGSDLFMSTDNGSTWQKISSEVELPAASVFSIRFSANSTYLFAGVGNRVWRRVRS